MAVTNVKNHNILGLLGMIAMRMVSVIASLAGAFLYVLRIFAKLIIPFLFLLAILFAARGNGVVFILPFFAMWLKAYFEEMSNLSKCPQCHAQMILGEIAATDRGITRQYTLKCEHCQYWLLPARNAEGGYSSGGGGDFGGAGGCGGGGGGCGGGGCG